MQLIFLLFSFFLDESNLGKTFEELCRAHIRAFAKGAEEFAINTQLSVRVDKWQAKLAPILEEEERRSAFDIHMYSQKLIDSAEQGRQKRKSDGSMQVSWVTKQVPSFFFWKHLLKTFSL